LVLAASLVAGSASADDRRTQYRHLRLADGRELVAEVLSTEGGGLNVKTPQGVILIPFDLLLDMSPADADAYELQESWHVYVAAPIEFQQPVAEAFRWMGGITVHLAGDAAPGMSHQTAERAEQCQRDLNCLREVTADSPWMWVVSVERKGAGLVAYAALNHSPTRTIFTTDGLGRDERWQLTHDLLQVQVPIKGGPPKVVGDPVGMVSRPPNSAGKGLAFVPIPGLAAGRTGKAGNVIASIAMTSIGTAAWVGAVGHGAQSTPEFAGLSAVGYYANVVVWNQAFSR
jgi:hypothetical protein